MNVRSPASPFTRTRALALAYIALKIARDLSLTPASPSASSRNFCDALPNALVKSIKVITAVSQKTRQLQDSIDENSQQCNMVSAAPSGLKSCLVFWDVICFWRLLLEPVQEPCGQDRVRVIK